MKETDVIITADQARVVLEHAGIFISGNRRSGNKKSLRHVKPLNLVVRCIIAYREHRSLHAFEILL